MQFGRQSQHRPFTLGRKPLDKEPSFLEVLYPPKQRGTRPYVPAYRPVESEQEKYYRNANGFMRFITCGISLVAFFLVSPFLIVVGTIILVAMFGR